MSFFKELKRRNVVRVGIAYTVATWLLIQVTDTVFPRIGLPDSAVTLVIALLFLGFIPALIFAWAFEMTPDGIKREKEVDRTKSITPRTGRKLDRMIIGIMTVVIAFLILDRFVLTDDTESSNQTTQIQATTPDAGTESAIDTGPSIAVLPFVNMSGDADNEYFSDGLTETLLHMLAQLPELRVAARTSSFAFKGKDAGIEEISKALNVAHILEGSVQKSGNRVRITAQLIRAEDGFHVWSQNYDRTLEDIFAIQDEIANDVAGALDASLLGGKPRSMRSIETTSLSAYDHYLKAMEQQLISSYSSLEVAESQFKQALSADPDFVDAKLGLVRNYFLMRQTGLIDEAATGHKVTPLLRQIHDLQPDNRLANAFELLLENDTPGVFIDEARREQILSDLRNLLPLLPTDTFIRRWVAFRLSSFHENHQDALAVIEAGLMIDPLSAKLYSTQGRIFQRMEDLDSATKAFQKAVQLEPDSPNHYGLLSALAGQQGDLVGRLNWMRKAAEVDPQDHELPFFLASALYWLQLPEEGDRWARKVAALAPASAIARLTELRRALGMKNLSEALQLSRAMIDDKVGLRRGAYGDATWVYSNLMMAQGRAREAYDYLVSQDPKIVDFSVLAESARSDILQYMALYLMRGFASQAEVLAAWEASIKSLDDAGIPWRNNEGDLMWDAILRGNDNEAAKILLEEEWSKPLASSLDRTEFLATREFAELLERPEVAARKAEMDKEYQLAQEQVRALLQTPEWNQ
jgi:TolB-like protein